MNNLLKALMSDGFEKKSVLSAIAAAEELTAGGNVYVYNADVSEDVYIAGDSANNCPPHKFPIGTEKSYKKTRTTSWNRGGSASYYSMVSTMDMDSFQQELEVTSGAVTATEVTERGIDGPCDFCKWVEGEMVVETTTTTNPSNWAFWPHLESILGEDNYSLEEGAVRVKDLEPVINRLDKLKDLYISVN